MNIPCYADTSRMKVFHMSPVDTHMAIIAIARSLCGSVQYAYKGEYCVVPGVINCYLLVHHCFTQAGVYIPRQFEAQMEHFSFCEPSSNTFGTAVYCPGARWNCEAEFHDGTRYRVGHVGILSETGRSVIHASQRAGTVVEESLTRFYHDPAALLFTRPVQRHVA